MASGELPPALRGFDSHRPDRGRERHRARARRSRPGLRVKPGRDEEVRGGQARLAAGATTSAGNNLAGRPNDVRRQQRHRQLHAHPSQRRPDALLREKSHTRHVPDDGTAKWRDLVEKSQKKPYFVK